MRKAGILLGVIGILIGTATLLAGIFFSRLAEAVWGSGPSSGPPISALAEIVLDTVDFIRLHVRLMVFFGVAFFVAGLAIFRRAKIREISN